MLDKASLIPNLLAKLEKLPSGEAIDLRTYKRNRSILIIKKTIDTYVIVENGFYQDRMRIPSSQLKKTLKTLVKREFPRSNKVRVYHLGSWDETKQDLPARKKL
jgi:hypothetical protein